MQDPENFYQFLEIAGAKNYEDYRKAIAGLGYLAQNVAFASRNGAIALTVEGQFPIRRFEQGRFVQDGALSDNAWAGYIPQSQLPGLRNPSRGFVFSANQTPRRRAIPIITSEISTNPAAVAFTNGWLPCTTLRWTA